MRCGYRLVMARRGASEVVGGAGVGLLAGGFGVDRGLLSFGVGELVEEVEDLLGGLAFEVREVLDRFLDQGVLVWFSGNFFCCGLGLDDLLLWTGDRGIGWISFG